MGGRAEFLDFLQATLDACGARPCAKRKLPITITGTVISQVRVAPGFLR